jgi:predicted nucleotidyltransferase
MMMQRRDTESTIKPVTVLAHQPPPAPTLASQVWPVDGKRLAEVSNPYGFLPVTEEILAEIVRRIVAKHDAEKIILFGSYAYGQPQQDSDVDILVVVKSSQSEIERYLAICQLLRPRPFPIDIIVKTPEELDEALKRNNFFWQKLLAEGGCSMSDLADPQSWLEKAEEDYQLMRASLRRKHP